MHGTKVVIFAIVFGDCGEEVEQELVGIMGI